MTAIPQHPAFVKYMNDANYIVLLPVDGTLEVSPFLKVHARELRFSEKMWFWAGGGYCLQKPGLMQLCAAANIGITFSQRTDDGRNPDFAAHSVMGSIRQPDGTARPLSGSKSIHVEEMIERDYNAKKKDEKNKGKSDAEIRALAEQSRASYRQFRAERAETGALERMIRNALGMKTAYIKDEIGKVFVIPVVSPNMDVLMMDPEVRRIAAVQALSATSTLYGPQARMLALPEDTYSPGTGTPAALPAGSVVESHPALPPAGPDAAPAGPTREEILTEEWTNARPGERSAKLNALLAEREHGLSDKAVDELFGKDAAYQAKLIAWLAAKPMKAANGTASGAPTNGTPTNGAQAPTDETVHTGTVGGPAWTPSEKQIKRLHGIAKKYGYDNEALHEFIAQRFGGITSIHDLTRDQYDALTGHEANPEYNQDELIGLLESNPYNAMAPTVNDTAADPKLQDLPF